jgi:hypothetical protein
VAVRASSGGDKHSATRQVLRTRLTRHQLPCLELIACTQRAPVEPDWPPPASAVKKALKARQSEKGAQRSARIGPGKGERHRSRGRVKVGGMVTGEVMGKWQSGGGDSNFSKA